MVSKASDDLPDPDRPVITTRLSRGMSTSIFFRLCSRAPRTESVLPAILSLMDPDGKGCRTRSDGPRDIVAGRAKIDSEKLAPAKAGAHGPASRLWTDGPGLRPGDGVEL